MALDAAAAAVAAEAAFSAFFAEADDDAKDQLRTAHFDRLFKVIIENVFAAIVAHAVVNPAGTPPMTTDGDAVIGAGRIE